MRTLATLALLLTMSSTPTTPSGQPGPMQPSDYTPAGPAQMVSWQVKRLPPPSALYVNVDDKLVVGAATSQANEVVTINYRLLRASDGKVVPGQFTVAPANTRTIAVQQQQLAEGFLLSVSVKASVATTRGQTFARIFLGAGPFGAGEPSYMLMADYVTTAMAPAHPNGRVLAPVEGPGYPVPYAVTAAAGTDWVLNIPANVRWRVCSIYTVFTATATVSNRVPRLIIRGQGNNVFVEPSPIVITANQIATISWGASSPMATDSVQDALGNIPSDMIIGGGGTATITVSTVGLDTLGGDKWTTVNVFVEEWLDNV